MATQLIAVLEGSVRRRPSPDTGRMTVADDLDHCARRREPAYRTDMNHDDALRVKLDRRRAGVYIVSTQEAKMEILAETSKG